MILAIQETPGGVTLFVSIISTFPAPARWMGHVNACPTTP
jgi:hypothetical protein